MKQDNNELKVIIKAKELAVHTIKLTSNCNKFPKKYRFTLCDRMQNKSMNIYELLLEANKIVEDDGFFKVFNDDEFIGAFDVGSVCIIYKTKTNNKS